MLLVEEVKTEQAVMQQATLRLSPTSFFAVIQVPYFFKLIGELSSDSWDIRRCLSQRVSSSINKAVAIRSRYRSV